MSRMDMGLWRPTNLIRSHGRPPDIVPSRWAPAVLAALWLLAGSALAQMAAPGSVSTPAPSRQAIVSANTALVTTGAAANLTGSWSGTNIENYDDQAGTTWNEEFTLQQDANGNIAGTRRTVSLQNPSYWALLSITGSVSGNTFTFQDVSVLSQNFPTGSPCLTSVSTTISSDGSSFSGPWTSSMFGCGGGTMEGTRYASDPAKNLGSGAPCDGGQGSRNGASTSSSGGSRTGMDCGQLKGAPTAGDPINISTGNKYLQEDDLRLRLG